MISLMPNVLIQFLRMPYALRNIHRERRYQLHIIQRLVLTEQIETKIRNKYERVWML